MLVITLVYISLQSGKDPLPDETYQIQAKPHVYYNRTVNLRVIVMTFNRPASLATLLASLNNLELDGDSAHLDIWIDRDKDGKVNMETLKTAQDFHWSRGRSHVHVHKNHMGIYGQWIDTWRPASGIREIAMILEDDLTLSPFAYLWLKAAHRKYDSLPYISGYTLQSENVNIATKGDPMRVDQSQPVYGYKRFGTWGFSPHAERWREFQDWYHMTRMTQPRFQPHVPKVAIITSWYRHYEKINKADTMWSMWFIYFSEKFDLYCVYSNLASYTANEYTMLLANRMENGLRVFKKADARVNFVLTKWSEKYADFPDDLWLHDWSGTRVSKPISRF